MKQKQVLVKKKIEFKSKSGGKLTDEEATTYGQHILKRLKMNKIDMVKPKEIVEDAKNPSTPYHHYFDWDNKTAGDEWRIHQARNLINSIMQIEVIHEESQPVLIRSFVSVSDEGERGYVPHAVIIKKPQLIDQVIETALVEAKTWKARYEIYRELSKISRAIDETIEELK